MKRQVTLLLSLMLCALAACAAVSHASLDLNGEWAYGLDRKYGGTTMVPGVPMDATRPIDGRLWYKRTVKLPEGDWNVAALELKGARFRPQVYVNGELVSEQEGGMIRSLHRLSHSALKPGASVTLEISLASLADVPPADASFIPKVDQWRSNCSSSLWDDVALHLYRNAAADRVLTFCDPEAHRATLRYRVNGSGAASARITVADRTSGKALLTRTGNAREGENEVDIDYRGVLQEWAPEAPNVYNLKVELLDGSGRVMSEWKQTLGLRRTAIVDKQIQLNGKPFKVRGGTVVWHRWMRDAEGRGVGYDTEWFYTNIIKRLKEHGANLLRFHLGVPPERLLDLCDEAGLAVQFEWNFFHGMPASRESLMEQYPKWFDMAARHPSIVLHHPYNETEGEQLVTAWSALDEIIPNYPPMIVEDRDIMHIHKYWWSLFENLGVYYDSFDQFPKAIMVDEFGGNYLDGDGQMGGYPSIRESYMRFLGRSHTAAQRLHHLDRSCGKVAEYWRRIGAAGVAPFTIASSYADGNHWFVGPLRDGNPKNVWNALTALWSPQAVSMDIWDCNFTPGQEVTVPLHFINDTDRRSTLTATVEVTDHNSRRSYVKTVECRVEPYSKEVTPCKVEMAADCGEYILRATLLNPTEDVKYPVVSEWDIRVFKASVSPLAASARIYIPANETELTAMARRLGLHTVDTPAAADLLLLGRAAWEQLPQMRTVVEKAVNRGAGVVMLDMGERYLGQGYPEKEGSLGPLQGVVKMTEPRVTTYDLFGGLSLTCTEAAEPESHIHPDSIHAELFAGITPRHTSLWNGLRGGLIFPAADFEVAGLSRDAFSAQWTRRGADLEAMKRGDYYAYELCGFFAFDTRPDNKDVVAALRRKAEFLVEDAPALAMSVNPKAPVRITDLGNGYSRSASGSATELVPLAAAGKNLTRTPAMRIGFGAGKGCVLLSGLLTAGRLDPAGAHEAGEFAIKYDEVAVQTVINMIDNALANSAYGARKVASTR